MLTICNKPARKTLTTWAKPKYRLSQLNNKPSVTLKTKMLNFNPILVCFTADPRAVRKRRFNKYYLRGDVLNKAAAAASARGCR
jgi:hypothetical protein